MSLSKRWITTWASVPVLDLNSNEFITDDSNDRYDEELGRYIASLPVLNVNSNEFLIDDSSDSSDEELRISVASVPVLDVNSNELLLDDSNHSCCEVLKKYIARFTRFVNGVLDNRGPTNVDTVSYTHHTNYGGHHSMGWLDRIALLMPRRIHINLEGCYSVDFPDSVFSCSSLQHLEMSLYCSYETTIIRPTSLNLPSLKVLELNSLELDDDFVQKILTGCPSLESLDLASCDLYISDISSDVLKELKFVGCYQYKPTQISCPGLASLYINYHRSKGISLVNMTSLVNASIHHDSKMDDLCVPDLLRVLSNITYLFLYLSSPSMKEQLEKDIPHCKPFNNLKTLCIGSWNMCSDFYLVASLLELSPNLQELVLMIDDVSQSREKEEARQEVLVDTVFKLEYLESVYIGVRGQLGLSESLIKILHTHVKKIGKIAILD